MKQIITSTCPRCGSATSMQFLDTDTARTVAALHTCADGVAQPSGEPIERWVPGPGERTRLPEERR